MTPMTPDVPAICAALADRLEIATGPDLEIDLRIAMLFHPEWQDIYEGNVAGYVKHGLHPAYTASQDAAMTLVPDGWIADILVNADRSAEVTVGHLDERGYYDREEQWAKRPSVAIALCAAALRARAHLLKEQQP